MASDDSKSQNEDDFELENVFNVKNMVALITSGGLGIGLMAAQALAVNGAKVYIVGRTEEKLETVVSTYSKGIAGSLQHIVADVSKKDGIAKLYDDFSEREKHLDILINNAGTSTATFNTEAGSAEELKKALFDNEQATFKDWSAVYRPNVSQSYFMTTCFLPLLHPATEKTYGWSSTVINICSISGQVKTTQHHPQYNASKAATIHLNRMLANEIQGNGLKIRVNSIAPGVFSSEMTAGESGANQKSFIPKDKYAAKIPAGRPGHDRDMANAILFAATNQYLNGQTVTVDGRYTLAAGK
nr:hypothetical protein B0A51_06093 [Rachicladosporium sp. CCFEE 5018]